MQSTKPNRPSNLDIGDAADLRAAVIKGAAYLDARNPAWYTLIDPTNLNMQSARSCVLGQLGRVLSQVHPTDEQTMDYGSFMRDDPDATIEFGDGCANPSFAASLVMTSEDAHRYGFNTKKAGSAWGYLDELWTHEVLSRI